MSKIRIFLFGKFRIEADGHLIYRLENRKAEELLVYLLLNRDQPQSREHLADVFWREGAPDQSKSYLRKALWQLQAILEPRRGRELLLVDGEWLQINPHFDFWLDVDILEKAFKDTQGIRGKDLKEKQSQSIISAVEIYRGSLMEGWYQDWCLYERERLQFLYLAMLDKLMAYCELQEDFEKGLIFGERILQYDRARERTHRRMMRLFYQAGDRTAALRQYQKCVAALKEELDVDPADRTRLLHQMIRTGKLENPVQRSRVHENYKTDLGEEPLSTVFNHLSALQKSLNRIQAQLEQDIKVIQKTLSKNQY